MAKTILNLKKKIARILIALLVVGNITIVQLLAQEVIPEAMLNQKEAVIGDHVNLNLSIGIPKNYLVQFPIIPDSIGKILFVNNAKIDTTQRNDSLFFERNLTITSFDTGTFEIPPFTFFLKKPNDTSIYPLSTNRLYLRYSGVPIDTAKPIKDIKPPFKVPASFWDYFWYIFIPIIIIALIYFGYKYYRKHKKAPIPIRAYDPDVPAHIQALKDLQYLEEQKLWQNGEFKKFHSEISEILRLYIERRFSFPALEETTSDINDEIERRIASDSLKKDLKQILELADLVKFAKYIPLPDENINSIQKAIEFVNYTKPIDVPNVKENPDAK